MNKYFTVEVKPTVSVAALAAGNIANTEILCDWHAFDVPKGSSRLIGITMRYTGKNGVYYTPTDYEILWAKSIAGNAPTTMGDDGANVNTHGWFPNIIGKTYIDSSQNSNDSDLIMGAIVTTASVSNGSLAGDELNSNSLVLTGEPDTGSSIGYDKLYMGIIAKGTHNWGPSTMAVSTETATSTPTLVVKTLSPVLSGIGPGDVLRDQADQLLGTVKSVDSATQITLEDNCASVSAVDQLVYNTCPITLVLSFEK